MYHGRAPEPAPFAAVEPVYEPPRQEARKPPMMARMGFGRRAVTGEEDWTAVRG